MIELSIDLFGWFGGIDTGWFCWEGLFGWTGWTGLVAGWLLTGLDYYLGAWLSWAGVLLTTGFIPPKRRSSISFSKLDLFLPASNVCFSYLAG